MAAHNRLVRKTERKANGGKSEPEYGATISGWRRVGSYRVQVVLHLLHNLRAGSINRQLGRFQKQSPADDQPECPRRRWRVQSQTLQTDFLSTSGILRLNKQGTDKQKAHIVCFLSVTCMFRTAAFSFASFYIALLSVAVCGSLSVLQADCALLGQRGDFSVK